MRKRPLLILMGGCILLLALLLSVKSENGLTRWLYGRHREKAGSGGVFLVEARIESVRKTTGGMRAVIRIQNGALNMCGPKVCGRMRILRCPAFASGRS